MSDALHELPRVHDLVLLSSGHLDAACTVEPPWVASALRHMPWVVVRRAAAQNGRLAVGVRGAARGERWGAFVELSQAVHRKRPSQLRSYLAPDSRQTIPALRALKFVETALTHIDFDWGPAGSVGFELVTGAPIATQESDLDLVLFAPRRIDPDTARDLWVTLAASPTKVDVLVETPVCGFSLEEYVDAGSAQILIRLPEGRRFVDDPWALPDVRDTK